MNASRDALIGFYAANGVAGVKRSHEFKRLCEQHERDPAFNTLLSHVRKAQDRLEKNVGQQISSQDQVVQALKLIRNVRGDAHKRGIYEALVARNFAANWSAEQREYFEMAGEMLATWHDYFLSFTSYNQAAPEFNFVNQDHALLLGVGMGMVLQRPSAIEQNLLALYLHRRLEEGGYRGFFYPHSLDPRTVVHKLVDEATRCLAFVQLLQRSMFRRYPDNYCHMEFVAAAEDDLRVFVFVLGESHDEFVAMADVHDELLDWYEKAMTHDAIVLEPAKTADEVTTLVATIKERVLGMVELAHRRVLERVPA